jgi:hypothetical protein
MLIESVHPLQLNTSQLPHAKAMRLAVPSELAI